MKKNYDCLAEIRKIRQRLSAEYFADPMAWMKHLDGLADTFMERYHPGEDPGLITFKGFEEE